MDLSTAFAPIMRQLALADDGVFSDEMVASVLHAFSMPPDAMDGLRAILQSPDALAEARVDLHCRLCVQSTHEDTWFLIQGHEEAGNSCRGSQAGDPLGDAVFMVIYTRVGKAARHKLVEAGCYFEVAYDPGVPLWCPPRRLWHRRAGQLCLGRCLPR